MKKYLWFRAKRYGYGWYPCTWQGWLIMAVYLLLLFVAVSRIDQSSHSVSDTLIGSVIPVILLTGALIVICVLTGEKVRWRWGGK